MKLIFFIITFLLVGCDTEISSRGVLAISFVAFAIALSIICYMDQEAEKNSSELRKRINSDLSEYEKLSKEIDEIKLLTDSKFKKLSNDFPWMKGRISYNRIIKENQSYYAQNKHRKKYYNKRYH